MSAQISRQVQSASTRSEASQVATSTAGPVSAHWGFQAFLLVIEVLHQSAEACPPLKSAVEGLMAIVTLFEVRARKLLSYNVIATQCNKVFAKTVHMRESSQIERIKSPSCLKSRSKMRC